MQISSIYLLKKQFFSKYGNNLNNPIKSERRVRPGQRSKKLNFSLGLNFQVSVYWSHDLGKVLSIAYLKSSISLDVSEFKQSVLLLRYCSTFQPLNRATLNRDSRVFRASKIFVIYFLGFFLLLNSNQSFLKFKGMKEF